MVFFRKLGRTIVQVVQYGCVAHCVLEYIADVVVCSGASMEPTLQTKNVLLTEHISPRMNSIENGDIIIAISPVDPAQYICKRVVGTPGDKIKCGNSHKVVPRGHVWLEGDNTSNSTDSRVYGPVSQGLIRGRVIYRLWPLNSIGPLSNKPVNTSGDC